MYISTYGFVRVIRDNKSSHQMTHKVFPNQWLHWHHQRHIHRYKLPERNLKTKNIQQQSPGRRRYKPIQSHTPMRWQEIASPPESTWPSTYSLLPLSKPDENLTSNVSSFKHYHFWSNPMSPGSIHWICKRFPVLICEVSVSSDHLVLATWINTFPVFVQQDVVAHASTKTVPSSISSTHTGLDHDSSVTGLPSPITMLAKSVDIPVNVTRVSVRMSENEYEILYGFVVPIVLFYPSQFECHKAYMLTSNIAVELHSTCIFFVKCPKCIPLGCEGTKTQSTKWPT